MNHIKKYESLFDQSYSIYLAGPDVFKNDAAKYLEDLKELSKKYSHVGLSPADNIEQVLKQVNAATKIFFRNISLIDKCDVIIANLEPFRGPNVDDGTAFEIGYGFSKGKKIYGYMEHFEKELKEWEEEQTKLANARAAGAIRADRPQQRHNRRLQQRSDRARAHGAVANRFQHRRLALQFAQRFQFGAQLGRI